MATAAPILDASETGADDDSAPVNAADLRTITHLAKSHGDLSHVLTETELTKIGAQVVEDYERDLADRSEWEETATNALDRAAQEKLEAKQYPWPNASNVSFPILTVAAQQFNARAYPAICKSGSMVKVRIIGSDKGRPQLDQNGQPVLGIPGPNGQLQPIQPGQTPPQAPQQPQGAALAPANDPNSPTDPSAPLAAPQAPPPQPQIMWQVPPGAKTKRADRVSDYLNVYLEYRMDDWEADTDLLLYQIPIIGCGFRKLWWSEGVQHASYISALSLVVPSTAKSLDVAPRTTEKMPDVYPYQIRQRQRAGEYRDIDLPSTSEDDEAPRLLLEQHRYLDMDDDGVDEPYIVTVDHETRHLLKIEANFGPDDVKMSPDGKDVIRIDRGKFYVKYAFLPDPKGRFYDIGFGHLLEQMGDIVNSAINQMFDAGHAQIAGGGWVASGLRLQGNNRTNTMRWMPGEYKTLAASGQDIRAGIVERTFPNVSPIMFQLLEMMLGAAKEITSVKDVVTGDASNMGAVGTTLALIEQGMAVFTAIYKRIYRSLGEEFALIYDNLSTYGGDEAAKDYTNVLDDPQANFQADFGEKDMDIKPVADPSSVTRLQQMAKAQFLLGMRGQGLNDMEINRRALEAANIDDIDALLPQPNAPPDPAVVAKLENLASQTNKNTEQATFFRASSIAKVADVAHRMGESDGFGSAGEGVGGGVSSLAAGPGYALGAPSIRNTGPGPAGGMGF